MVEQKKGFFRSLFVGADEVRSSAPAAPNMTTSPPTWEAVSHDYISVADALSIPSVYRATTLLSTTVSQLDITVTRKGETIVSALAARPDNNRSRAAFFKRTMYNLVTTGNAYWRLYRNGDGAVVQMECLEPSAVSIQYDKAGNKVYTYTNRGGRTDTLTNNSPTTNGQVEHIRLGEFEGHILGRGPIQVCNRSLASVYRQREYYDRFLDDAKRPSGIYSFEDWLDDDEREQAHKVIDQKTRTGAPLVLGKGASYKTVMFTAEEAALIEMNKAGIAEVARIFGLPAHFLNAANESNNTYQNIQQADVAYLRYAAEEYLTAIEDGFSNVLPLGQEAHFDTENWLRAAAVAEPAAPTTTQGGEPQAA